MDYDGSFIWGCPNCKTKNRDEVDHAMIFTCECANCGEEYEIYLQVEVDIEKIIKVI